MYNKTKLPILYILFTFICASQGTNIIVPAYFPWWREYGTRGFEDLEDFAFRAPSGRLIVVINPSSGPYNETWGYFNTMRTFAEKIKGHCQYPIGYIFTDYGDRGIDLVKADIMQYLDVYGIGAISGFFFDEVSSLEENKEYYIELINYANRKLAEYADKCTNNYGVVLNPGSISPTVQELTMYANLTIVRETTEDSFLEEDDLPVFVRPEKKGVLIHSCRDYNAVFNKAEDLNVGYHYCTDFNVRENPWRRLARHWDDSAGLILG